jgi:hypothetical protein
MLPVEVITFTAPQGRQIVNDDATTPGGAQVSGDEFGVLQHITQLELQYCKSTNN